MSYRNTARYAIPSYFPQLLVEAARAYRVNAALILAPGRAGREVQARQAVMYVLREQGLSFPHIAHLMERKDHTTVMHGVRRVEADRGALIQAMALELAVMGSHAA